MIEIKVIWHFWRFRKTPFCFQFFLNFMWYNGERGTLCTTSKNVFIAIENLSTPLIIIIEINGIAFGFGTRILLTIVPGKRQSRLASSAWELELYGTCHWEEIIVVPLTFKHTHFRWKTQIQELMT